MDAKHVIGIDPDSRGFICASVKGEDPKVVTKEFVATESDVQSFLRWVNEEGEVVVAIEGANGLSRPIEAALREAGRIFYSFKPADTDRFRKAVLGQNKNNEKDAESVARYAMALASQGKLERYRRVWFPDGDLQMLSRTYERGSQELTVLTNRLWKLLRRASPDLYLMMKGNHPEGGGTAHVLTGQGFLSLLIDSPDIGTWKQRSAQELLEAMGGGNYPGRRELIENVLKATATARPISPSIQLLLRKTARKIESLKEDQGDMATMLGELLEGVPAAQALLAIRGIGVITAATMIAEIIDIRRFASEDRLASYCGLGMAEHSTGESARMVHTRSFNHRLKDAFMTAAQNFVRYNPDAHLSGYYRNLVKRGMAAMEATKRVARALVRLIYRRLMAVIMESEAGTPSAKDVHQEGEGGMASGNTRGDKRPLSNIPPSSLEHDTTTRRRTASATASPRRQRGVRTKKGRPAKKSA